MTTEEVKRPEFKAAVVTYVTLRDLARQIASAVPPHTMVCANPHCKTKPDAHKTICSHCKTAFCSWDCRTYCFEHEQHESACKHDSKLYSARYRIASTDTHDIRTGILETFVPFVLSGKHRWLGGTVKQLFQTGWDTAAVDENEDVVGKVVISAKFNDTKDRFNACKVDSRRMTLGSTLGTVVHASNELVAVLMKEGIDICEEEEAEEEEGDPRRFRGKKLKLDMAWSEANAFISGSDELFVPKDGVIEHVARPGSDDDDDEEVMIEVTKIPAKTHPPCAAFTHKECPANAPTHAK